MSKEIRDQIYELIQEGQKLASEGSDDQEPAVHDWIWKCRHVLRTLYGKGSKEDKSFRSAKFPDGKIMNLKIIAAKVYDSGESIVQSTINQDPKKIEVMDQTAEVKNLAREVHMKRKFQVFISSTYEDLKAERRAAIDAVLSSKHIPAGMEQFSSGDEPQKEVIKQWIQECDVYLLILGGKYGSVAEGEEESYTHWEYEYAGQIGKPRFSVVLTDEAIEQKVKEMGSWVTERKNYAKWEQFRNDVLNRISRKVNDPKDIQLAIQQKLADYDKDPSLTGWIPTREVPNVAELEEKIKYLNRENEYLKSLLSQQQVVTPVKSKTNSSLKTQHIRFLEAVYDAVGGRVHSFVNMWEVGESLNFNRDETDKIMDRLDHVGFLKPATLGGGIEITHEGIIYVEDKRENETNELEKEILSSINAMDYLAAGAPNADQFNRFLKSDSPVPELAYYLLAMERKGLIDFDGKPFVKGGRQHPKFNNNVLSIMFDKIHITSEGIRLIVE